MSDSARVSREVIFPQGVLMLSVIVGIVWVVIVVHLAYAMIGGGVLVLDITNTILKTLERRREREVALMRERADAERLRLARAPGLARAARKATRRAELEGNRQRKLARRNLTD